MERIEEILDGVKTMGIGGHVRPDGDCIWFLRRGILISSLPEL